jgi:transcriptional regulator with XRE-family HTH domain
MNKNYPEAVLNTLVAMLKEKRLSMGLSHERLSAASGITRAAISHVENGKRKPSLLLCLKMANAMQISLADMLKKAEQKISQLDNN